MQPSVRVVILGASSSRSIVAAALTMLLKQAGKTLIVGEQPTSEDTITIGKRLGQSSFASIHYVKDLTHDVLIKGLQHLQPMLTIGYHTRAIRICSGIKPTGNRCAPAVTRLRRPVKIWAHGRQRNK